MAKREYIQANKDWLEAKAQEDGVKALPKGIYYKVLAEGDAQSGKPSLLGLCRVATEEDRRSKDKTAL